MKTHPLSKLSLSLCLSLGCASVALAATPQYSIVDLGVVSGDSDSQAFGASPNGSYVVGRSMGSQGHAYSWSAQDGMQALPNLAGRKYAVANAVNDAGIAVGVSSTTVFGSAPLPVMWKQGAVTALTMPLGYNSGWAYSINSAGVAVGAVGSGSFERAALFGPNGSSLITATAANGAWMSTAFGINDAGLVIGVGVDPDNAAVNVGMVYNSVTGVMSTVGALPGHNSAINFGLSNSGYVVGSSGLYQGSGTPFIWSAEGGMTEIGLPPNTSSGSASAVNEQGWVVGNAGGEYSVPFLYADGATYSLQSLLPAGTDWDFSTNTSASAMAISKNGSIVGTAVHNGLTHAYQMTLVSSVPEPESVILMLSGLGLLAATARRRREQTQA
ncbi:PEP-CTERM sorting domain-containing protein [Paucibacter sp. Y2R2-4]|uniref:PEP-CTERM sorting domain-containing protein n=1 Tax=Paucibacter sp. Y2R2-4 TaxID=2893553 RepID=UPI0021E3EE9D|nr:PEP-CTERM sorting domain-containing protein [Paucibacter sp. Y2R2-4]MCV2350901.1 PEP-CTERM sorting domain-containing protein [Paucibacter sp. Y2R2-4]